MANDKRDSLRKAAIAKFEADEGLKPNGDDVIARADRMSMIAYGRGFDSGYAAATAEGIPQSDGWVAIRQDDSHYKFQTLPQIDGQYVGKRRDSEYNEIFFINKHKDKWLLCQRFEAWMPIPPYQR